VYILIAVMLIILLLRQAHTPMPEMEWAKVTGLSQPSAEEPAV
jgi:hypothetical protein